MKKIIYSLLVCVLFTGFYSCEDDTTQDTSKITYYVDLELKGDQTMLVAYGSEYVEPGYTAIEGEADVTSSVVVSGEINTNVYGIQMLTYSAVNADGFSTSVTRYVIVYNPTVTTVIPEGIYTAADGTHRISYASGTGVQTNYSGYTVNIEYIAPGIYHCSDFLGGYYDQGVGYGSAYAMTGYFMLNADNTIELLSSHVSAWGDSLESMDAGIFDPLSGDIYWEVVYTDYPLVFYVTLTKN